MDRAPIDYQRAFFANGGCRHPAAEPVITVDGEHVGYLCPDCDKALQADRLPRFDGYSTVLSGVGAYWTEEA